MVMMVLVVVGVVEVQAVVEVDCDDDHGNHDDTESAV